MDLLQPDCSSDDARDDVCAHATVKFKEGDHVTLWVAVLAWAVNAKVQKRASAAAAVALP
jgi:hypothetical protein